MESDPVAVDLNVDAALLLQELAGIESYPPVLAVLPNIYDLDDRHRVRVAVAAELSELGIVVGGAVHPAVERWLHCLHRPDVELVARIVDTGLTGGERTMLRFSLVRSAKEHVLALRCGDSIVIQPVFQGGRELRNVTAALTAALGFLPPVRFEPVSADLAEFEAVPDDPAERRAALLALGAHSHSAAVLTRVLGEVVRRAEIVAVQHRDGGSTATEVCLSVLDTVSGRLVVIPHLALDGRVRSTFAPGDDAAVHAGVAALLELLPGRSWFDTSRIQ
ncbi:ESX secretion-associated protein EspG [Nocardia asteroides]|uniref:ESX secretion-associated protein EspG n=1 Tax=Nocardia asteroides TaxID=1824 RepID=UPI001E502AE4|nr:ESX secretion-associated protein EspG [Nocardia asteroides]UGT63339.1 ESX secretion-associated protein EspG [Nocardia asteroides]